MDRKDDAKKHEAKKDKYKIWIIIYLFGCNFSEKSLSEINIYCLNLSFVLMQNSCRKSKRKSSKALEETKPKDIFIIFHFYEDSLADLAVLKSKYTHPGNERRMKDIKNYNPNSKDEKHEIEVDWILVTSHHKRMEVCFWVCIGKPWNLFSSRSEFLAFNSGWVRWCASESAEY